MLKTLYLITFLSVVLLNCEASFAQVLKKELGICGKSLNTILKVEKDKDPVFTTALMREDEFCDNGRYEENANFTIMLYNAKNELVYDKQIYINPLTFSEVTNEKGEFIKTKISNALNTRIVKFPVSPSMGEIVSYKIKTYPGNKIFETKKFKW